MTVVTQQSSSAAPLTDASLYRLVWKWHFLAALFVLPFMAMLSLTGGVYLYKDQINNWLYSDRLYISPKTLHFQFKLKSTT
ncbi:MAG: PepSY domain-containing protein [Paracoccaceae bacterium]